MKKWKRLIAFFGGFILYYTVGLELIGATVPWVIVNTPEEAQPIISWVYWILGLFQGQMP